MQNSYFLAKGFKTSLSVFLCMFTISVAFAQTSPNPIQAVTPFYVQIGAGTVDVSKFGYFHNALLTYAKQNMPGSTALLSKCQRVELASSLSNNGIASGTTELRQYIPPYSMNCTEYDNTFPKYYGTDFVINIDSVRNAMTASINQALDKGIINQQEKSLLDNYLNMLISNQPVNYTSLKSQWNLIPSKPYGGSYSSFIIVIGAHSTEWWKGQGGSGNQALWIHDIACAVVGTVKYIVKNWDDHFLPEFGMNFLEAGGNAAVHGSTFGLFGH